MPAGFRAVSVETGLTNDEFVEITSGLEEGDEVYIDESSKDSGSMAAMQMMPGSMGNMGGGSGGGPGGEPGGR